MTQILTYSDNRKLSLELATSAGALCGDDHRTIELDSVREGAAAGSIILVKSAVRISSNYDLVAFAIAEAMKKTGASVVLLGATRLGRMVAGKLAVMQGIGVLSDVRRLSLDDGVLAGVRGVYAGRFNAKVEASLPCAALVPQGASESSPAPPSEVEDLVVVCPASRIKRLESRPNEKSELDLRGAKVIVSAGRGIKTKEDLDMIRKLAAALGGAMGASRPLTSDLGWLGEEYHIGLTGTYVHPNLYLAVGISGQLQHVAGIKDSKVIAAINKDKLAPIFQVSDYGIVGDLYEVVPALLKLLGAG